MPDNDKCIEDYLLDFYKMSTDQQNILNAVVASYKKVVKDRDMLLSENEELKNQIKDMTAK